MLAKCELCKDGVDKECSVFFYPEYYGVKSNIFCEYHEVEMRDFVNNHEEMKRQLLAVSVRRPDLEVGLDPIYKCRECGGNFSSKSKSLPVTELFCDKCKKDKL